ncbi:S46 family peptidase [Aliifodinibius sp. S!AR15-10]|uniref:S46 family peptidase n=1 Tax=Aliifodinibius sp. S!AR15-10 TaxID=2950437 RepID=UPI0028554563|nr:S46 family peptidase [Aliifodinibius sp. S!AR15-10]MDR8392683.1 S46 family peptidase [Aliifodinibius sp. S!AR15-10]
MIKTRPWALLFSFLFITACTTTSSLQQQQSATQTGNSQGTDLTHHYLFGDSPDDSGMWLLPQIKGAVHAEMAAKGLKLTSDEMYSQMAPSLNQAIVRLNIGEGGGGTASFVSARGLLLTNHHVAYDAITSASTAKQNYLDQGFYAETNAQEIPAEGYSLYIPIEQVEVTEKISSMLPDTLNAQKQNQLEQQVRQKLIQKRKGGNEDLVVEIDDYWAGNRQFMAVYRVIRDVRLVYAPPSSIGKYGGDIDNWEWPRHTGDYAFLRAYVAPDGSARPHNAENVPFQPSRHLQINANGVQPNDFTMTLGFPGSTYRYQSSYAFDFYHNVRNPVMIDSFQAILDAMEYAAEQDEEIKVENASDRASVANTLKYLKGVQDGFDRYDIIERKEERENEFQQWIESDSTRNIRYGRVLSQLDTAFNIASQTGDLLYGTYYALNNNTLLQVAGLYDAYYEYLNNPDSLSFSSGRKDTLLMQHRQMLDSSNLEAQTMMLDQMVTSLSSFPSGKRPMLFIELFEGKTGDELKAAVQQYIENQVKTSLVYSADSAEAFLNRPVEEVTDQPVDPVVKLYWEIYNTFDFSRNNYSQHFAYLNPARERYVEGMLAFRQDSTEYPDANFTLRLSGGRVLGYSAVDGLYNSPYTTFEGMIAKDTDEEPFDAPQMLENYFQNHSGGSSNIPYATPSGHLVVNLLTTNDITGGNSGSPLLNGNGEVVGIAFDSNYEGVIGDYYYDPDLNRTINVDIRYVLFLMEEFSNADRILNELNIIREGRSNIQAEAAVGIKN